MCNGHLSAQRDIDRADDFDRIEILGRLRVVERGERTSLERNLQTEVERLRAILARQEK